MTQRSIILACNPSGFGDCSGDAFQARAGRSATRAMLHCLGHTAPIPIAVFALSYFAAAVVSGAGQ